MKLAAERRWAIMRTAHLRGAVSVTEIAKRLGVSTVTVRRDVAHLVAEGKLERVYGGATLVADPQPTPATPRRSSRRPAFRATIGMVVPSANYYFPTVINGAEAAATAANVKLILATSHYYPTEDARQVQRLLDLGVDALLLTTSEAPDDDRGLSDWVQQLPVPTVLVERQVDLPHASAVEFVHTDHQAGVRLGLSHLAELGHDRIALAARDGSPTTRWLLQGHVQSMEFGRLAPGTPEPVLLPRPEGDPRRRAEALERLIEVCLETQTRAAIVHTDEDAVELMLVANAQGIDVPADLAIVAYDDEIAALADVPLTAIAPPKRDVGRTAVEMVMRQLTESGGPTARHVSLLPRLTVRSSCGADRL